MVPQYVHWKSKPVSNLYQPGRNLEKKKINPMYFKLRRVFSLIQVIVFLKDLPIVLVKSKVVFSEVEPTKR